MIKNFRTYFIAVEFYKQAKKLSLPRHLKDQLNRASSSVVLNLAEGHGHSSRNEQKRFFTIAFASLRESESIFDLSMEISDELRETTDKLAAHMYKLIQKTS